MSRTETFFFPSWFATLSQSQYRTSATTSLASVHVCFLLHLCLVVMIVLCSSCQSLSFMVTRTTMFCCCCCCHYVITAVVKDEEEEVVVVVVVVVVLVVVVLWLKIWKNVAFLEEVVACLYATFFYRGSNIPLRKCKARPWDVHSIPLEQVRSVFHIF